MRRPIRIAASGLLLCSSLALAQDIYVSAFRVSGLPSTCTGTPYAFQVTFKYFVNIYDCNGQLSSSPTFLVTGTGYCSGLFYFCPEFTASDPIASDQILGQGPWIVNAYMVNCTSGFGGQLGAFGCGGYTTTVSTHEYPLPCCPSCYPDCPASTPPGDAAQCASPIVIDTRGEGFHLTDAAHGVIFRERDGLTPIRLSWTDPAFHNGWLALPEADGSIQSLADLFGNFTPQPASDDPNGYRALAVYDENHDGVIDTRDAIYTRLRVWIDSNHDGIAQPEELHTLEELGVERILLDYRESFWTDHSATNSAMWRESKMRTRRKTSALTMCS
jgi:hypothetical protein